MQNRFVEASVEIYERALRPESPGKGFPGHKFARLLEEGKQQLQGLIPKFRLPAVVRQFSGLSIQLEGPETVETLAGRNTFHTSRP